MADQFEERIVELAYRWPEVEKALADDPNEPCLAVPNEGDREHPEVELYLSHALDMAFRVEAVATANRFGDEATIYELFYDVQDDPARAAARVVREFGDYLHDAINAHVPIWDPRYTHIVRVVPRGTPAEGQECERRNPRHRTRHVDVSDVPVDKPRSNVPLEQRDGYWLTPIEVPFYDALRDTGLVFAVQPWIQGVESRFRLDFLVFYGGGMVAVELDGHESHKSREQRTRDARRDRWFAARDVRTLRWTGSEVHANPQECVRQLLEILRGSQARP
jgi:very-short-patch-repair endonuclease